MAKNLVVFLIVAVISGSYGMSYRHKRQSSDNEDAGLDERYGLDRPRELPSWFPNQNALPNQFPWQNQNQNGGQGQFPWQNQNGGQGGQNQQQQTPTQAPNPSGSTTLSSSIRQCMNNCPVTPEYNPVCGSDSVTYTNPGRLGCAQACGVSVTLLRSSPCPATTPAPTN